MHLEAMPHGVGHGFGIDAALVVRRLKLWRKL